MRYALRFAVRSLRVRPSRTLLTMSGITLGVAVILAISISNLSTLESVIAVFDETSGKAHLIVASASSSGQGFPESALRRIAPIPGVQAAIPSLQAQAILADERPPEGLSVNTFGEVQGLLALYGVDPALEAQARDYKMVAGQFLSPDLDAYEVVLVKDYAEQKGLRLGGELAVRTAAGVESMRIVGLMSKEGAGQLNNGAFGIMPLRAAQRVFGRTDELDQIDIVAEAASAGLAGLERLQASLQARLGDQYAVLYPASRGRRVTEMLETYRIGFGFFSAVALFVGAFLIYNAFSMTVVERTREIGMLRTVGMTRRQVFGQILSEAAILGSLGAVLGVGLGLGLSKGVIRIMELLLSQPVRQIHVPLAGLLTSVLVGIGVTVSSAVIPAWQAGRVSPLEALRVRAGPQQGRPGKQLALVGLTLALAALYLLYFSPFEPTTQYAAGGIAVFGLFLGTALLIPVTVGVWQRLARPWVRGLYGGEGGLGIRNVERGKLRTALTVICLVVGSAMILSIRTTTSAYEQDIQSWIDRYVGGDLYVHATLPMRADLRYRLQAVEGVAIVTPLHYFDVEWRKPDGGSERLTFLAIEPATYRQVTSVVFAGGQGDAEALLDRLDAGDAVFVSTVLAEKYGLKNGDALRLETRRGPKDLQVIASVVNFQSRGLVVQGSWQDMRRYFGVDEVSAFLLRVKPGYTAEAVQERIRALYGERRHLTVDSNEALKRQAFTMTSQAFSMFNVLVYIAMVVATLGVINTLTVSVLERTREIGMLRSLGMTRRQIGKMILAEAGLMGFAGGVLGLLFGLLLSRLFIQGASAVRGYELSYVLPLDGVLACLLIAFVFSQLAALWPARHAARVRIIEAIQCE